MVQSVMCTRSLVGFPLQHRGYKLDNRKFSAVASFKPPVEQLVLLPAYLFSRPGMSKQFCYYKCKSPDVYTFFVILSFYLFWRKIWYRSWRIIWDSFLLDGASEITNGHVDRVKAFTSKLAGLMSRCMIPFWWRNAIPSRACLNRTTRSSISV
jgi:hypothetical protein